MGDATKPAILRSLGIPVPPGLNSSTSHFVALTGVLPALNDIPGLPGSKADAAEPLGPERAHEERLGEVTLGQGRPVWKADTLELEKE